MTSDEIFHNNENISKRNTDERGRKFSEKGGKGNNMLKYILKRILYIIPVMFGVIVLVFIMKTVTPGDPVASLLPGTATEEMKNNLREQLGLNDPVLKQFGSYVLGVVQGDLGTSYKTRQPVAQEIAMRLPNTITIAIWAMFIAQIIATPLGILAAVKQPVLQKTVPGNKDATVLQTVPDIPLFLQPVPDTSQRYHLKYALQLTYHG